METKSALSLSHREYDYNVNPLSITMATMWQEEYHTANKDDLCTEYAILLLNKFQK